MHQLVLIYYSNNVYVNAKIMINTTVVVGVLREKHFCNKSFYLIIITQYDSKKRVDLNFCHLIQYIFSSIFPS